MNKKNKYEPEMPEYLKKSLGLDKPRKKKIQKKTTNDKISNKPAKKPIKSNATKKNKVAEGKSTEIRKNKQQVIKNTNKSKRSTSNLNSSSKKRPVPQNAGAANKINKKKQSTQKYTSKKKVRKKRAKSGILYSIIYFISIFIGFIVAGGDKERYISGEKKKEYDFKFYRNISIGFVVVLVLVMILNIITPSSKTSVAENRELQQRPKLSVSRLLYGKFASDYSKFISDQFLKRDMMIKVKAKFDLFMGKREINGVYIAKDDYLMEGFRKSEDSVTSAKVAAINSFANNNSKMKVSFMLVPNKVEIYKNLLPNNNPDDSQKEYVNGIKKELDSKIKLVDLFDTFEKNKNNIDLYFKTDHHWTTDGAYLAYVEFCKAINIEPINEKMLEKNLASNTFKGSLYYKNGAQIGRPDELYIYLNKNEDKPVVVKYYDDMKKVPSLYDSEKLQGRDPYEVFTGGNHSQIKIRTNINTSKKLLVIKDSYANAMLPFLVNNFSEINVVDLRYFTGSLKDVIQNNDVTDILILHNINTFNTDSSIMSLND